MTTTMQMAKTAATFMLGAIVVALFISFFITPLFTQAATLDRQLEIGMSGADVGILQTYLATNANVYPAGLITNYFGSLTQAAVSVFQSNNGIPSVGRVGPMTLAAINSKMNDSTVGSNRTAPTITSLNVETNSSGAELTWKTGEAAAGIVYYDTRPIVLTEASSFTDIKVSGTAVLDSVDLTTAHTIALKGLKSDTTYYYSVYVRDGFGNVSVTWPSSFTTAD